MLSGSRTVPRPAASRPRGNYVESFGLPARDYRMSLPDQRNVETRYEYRRDVGQDVPHHRPKGLMNLCPSCLWLELRFVRAQIKASKTKNANTTPQ